MAIFLYDHSFPNRQANREVQERLDRPHSVPGRIFAFRIPVSLNTSTPVEKFRRGRPPGSTQGTARRAGFDPNFTGVPTELHSGTVADWGAKAEHAFEFATTSRIRTRPTSIIPPELLPGSARSLRRIRRLRRRSSLSTSRPPERSANVEGAGVARRHRAPGRA